jgi:hypothetical protein
VPVEPEPVAVEPVAVEPVEEDESLRRRTPAQPRYRNPENPEQTWTGPGKRRYSIKAAQIGDAAPAHAPASPRAQDEEPLSYAQIIALAMRIN